jgi:hypothetical protein
MEIAILATLRWTAKDSRTHAGEWPIYPREAGGPARPRQEKSLTRGAPPWLPLPGWGFPRTAQTTASGARCPRFASCNWTLTWAEKDWGGHPSLHCLSEGKYRVALQRDDLQAGDHLEVAKVRCSHAVAEFQSGHPDQQIRKWKADAFGLILAIDLPRVQRDRHGDGMDGQSREQLLNKLVPRSLSLWRVGAGCTVGQFDQRDDGDGDLGVARWPGDGGEHLSRILPSALGCNQYAGV